MNSPVLPAPPALSLDERYNHTVASLTRRLARAARQSRVVVLSEDFSHDFLVPVLHPEMIDRFSGPSHARPTRFAVQLAAAREPSCAPAVGEMDSTLH